MRIVATGGTHEQAASRAVILWGKARTFPREARRSAAWAPRWTDMATKKERLTSQNSGCAKGSNTANGTLELSWPDYQA